MCAWPCRRRRKPYEKCHTNFPPLQSSMTMCNGILERNAYMMTQFRVWVTFLFPICPNARSRPHEPLFYLHILTYIWTCCMLYHLHFFMPILAWVLIRSDDSVLSICLLTCYYIQCPWQCISWPVFELAIHLLSDVKSFSVSKENLKVKVAWRRYQMFILEKHKTDTTHKPNAQTSASEHEDLHHSDRTGTATFINWNGLLLQLKDYSMYQDLQPPSLKILPQTLWFLVQAADIKRYLLLYWYVIHNNLFLETTSAAYAPPSSGHSHVNNHTADWVRSFKLACWILSWFFLSVWLCDSQFSPTKQMVIILTSISPVILSLLEWNWIFKPWTTHLSQRNVRRNASWSLHTSNTQIQLALVLLQLSCQLLIDLPQALRKT